MNLITVIKKSILMIGRVKIAFIILINLDIIRIQVYSVLHVQFLFVVIDGVSLVKKE